MPRFKTIPLELQQIRPHWHVKLQMNSQAPVTDGGSPHSPHTLLTSGFTHRLATDCLLVLKVRGLAL